ncbi:hypothetical protein M885DRAFT_531211 [Pelagophyceae sp. CCMP2097]|nr:hypothetical protein M885DRAFT_531211 [Pelagophyceae sp. CCMP2097]
MPSRVGPSFSSAQATLLAYVPILGASRVRLPNPDEPGRRGRRARKTSSRACLWPSSRGGRSEKRPSDRARQKEDFVDAWRRERAPASKARKGRFFGPISSARLERPPQAPVQSAREEDHCMAPLPGHVAVSQSTRRKRGVAEKIKALVSTFEPVRQASYEIKRASCVL